MIDGVALDRHADAEVVEVGGDDHHCAFRVGSEPGSIPTTLGEVRVRVSAATLALSEGVRAKRGSGLWASASASSSAKLWPEPANRAFAFAGLQLAVKIGWS